MRFYRYHGRVDAAAQLAPLVRSKLRDLSNAVVISVPRGGVVIGTELAKRLGLPHDIVVTRKIAEEEAPEWAIGAVTEASDVIWDKKRTRGADPAYMHAAATAQTKEAKRRIRTFRNGLPRRNVYGKTVILTDDGVARGWTLLAAIATLRSEGAKEIIVATPVASSEGMTTLSGKADGIVAGYVPKNFKAVGAYYRRFTQISDERVIALLHKRKT